MIEIIEYWNKVVNDSNAPFGTRVIRDEYEIKTQYRMDSNLDELKRRWKNHPEMTIHQDKIIEDCGRVYGIHSYREIRRC